MSKPEKSDSSFRYEKADDSVGFLLWKIITLWQGKVNQILEEFGITQTQYAILASLLWFEEKSELITQAQLVAHTKIDKMTLSKAIRRLEQQNLVIRDVSDSDNRAMNVKFSITGKAIIQKAIVAIEKADEDFVSCLSNTQLQLYKEIMQSIIKHSH